MDRAWLLGFAGTAAAVGAANVASWAAKRGLDAGPDAQFWAGAAAAGVVLAATGGSLWWLRRGGST